MNLHPRHEEICAVLRRGGIVIMRSDTVYGVHGVAPATGARLTALKGRPDGKPLLVLLADGTQRQEDHRYPTATCPGGAVARPTDHRATGGESCADSDRGGREESRGTGARRPGPARHRRRGRCATLLDQRQPGRRTPRSATPWRCVPAFGGSVELIVDDGPVTAAVPSTIVDATVSPARVLRAGAVAVTAAQLSCAGR